MGLINSSRKSSNTFHAAMRVPVVEYITLALSSGLTSYGVPGPQSVEVVSSDLRVMDTTTPSCWAPASGVSANYGPINDL